MPRPISMRPPLLREPLFRARVVSALAGTCLAVASCTVAHHQVDDTSDLQTARVRPGITVLLRDSVSLIRNKKIGLLTNQTGVDRSGTSDVELLRNDPRAVAAKVKLAALFAPEHGLSGTADRTNLPFTTDKETGLPVYSLYGAATVAPPDSVVWSLDAVVIDLQDVGSRTWTYEGAMVYTMRAAARMNKPVIVLDRPNPITGSIVEGPVLDSALSNAEDPAPGKPGLAYALAPIPLRHGMTMGELARYYNDVLHLNADLHVVPALGWHREVWFDRTGLKWVKPSPNLPSFQSVIVYPALVPFEATNLSVGRGFIDAFQIVGAPWLNSRKVIQLLNQQVVRGALFRAEDFTPENPSDGKYKGQKIHGIRIIVNDRNALQTTRLAAALFSAIHKTHPTEFTIDSTHFDRLFGDPESRRALLRGDDPDAVADRAYGPAYAFREKVRKYLLY